MSPVSSLRKCSNSTNLGWGWALLNGSYTIFALHTSNNIYSNILIVFAATIFIHVILFTSFNPSVLLSFSICMWPGSHEGRGYFLIWTKRRRDSVHIELLSLCLYLFYTKTSSSLYCDLWFLFLVFALFVFLLWI